jgi:hypothetical protein
MRTTDEQVLRLRAERARGWSLEVAAMRAGMHRNTARKYVSGPLPSERGAERSWRTRPDPFAEDWPTMVAMLADAPTLEAKALFEHLQGLRPGRYQDAHLRTFQRRVKHWRATQGPEKEIFFPQAHRPGEALQTDFTHAKVLGITIQGQPFPHLLCVSVLPYSNWRWATPCRSESILALSEGVQNAVFELGHVPQYHQTDHSTAATHLVDSAWVFNDEYEALMRHLGMSPRTTEVGRKEQNGSIEAMNGALKRHLEQELLLRGSRDFESLAAYEAWLQAVLRKGNRGRSTRLAEELAVMRPLGVRRLPDYKVVDVRVGSGSTIRAKSCTYSVPARLIGERVRVHVHETRVKVYLGGQHQVTLERVRGRGAHNVNWRHVIGWMVKKPGAFRRYRYRDALFPTSTFREAWERLDASLATWSADTNYLQVLKRAQDTGQGPVEAAVRRLLDTGVLPRLDEVVRELKSERPCVPAVAAAEVDLSSYDDLTPEASEEVAR